MPERPAYLLVLYQIKSAIAKLLVSFQCQVKIREGQAEETAWGYGWNRDYGGRVMAQE